MNPIKNPTAYRFFVVVVKYGDYHTPRTYSQTTWYVTPDDVDRLRAGDSPHASVWVKRPGRTVPLRCAGTPEQCTYLREIIGEHDRAECEATRDFVAQHPGGW